MVYCIICGQNIYQKNYLSRCQYLYFLNNLFNGFCPLEQCGVIPHCLYRDSLTLTLLVPIPDEEKKLGQIFILAFLCDASKGFYEGLKGTHKTFLRPS